VFYVLKDRRRRKEENHNVFVHLDNQPSLSHTHQNRKDHKERKEILTKEKEK
jgi:hypothetical protein